MNLYPVTVIDNFYENPDAVRKFALAQKYTYCRDVKNIDYVYPGGRSNALQNLDAKLYEAICTKLISIFHNSQHDYMRWAVSTSFQSVTEDFGDGVIHTDHNTVFAAVLYLTPNAPLNGGTSLFKPNAKFNEEKYQRALALNDERFRSGKKDMLTDYHSMFDEVVRVNNVYNTLILYEGSMYHAANKFFGSTLKTSRLAQVFFINRIDAQKADSFPLNRAKAIKV